MSKKFAKYIGISYPRIFDNRFTHKLWKKFLCKRHWHLFDEVLSLTGHYLYCDACEFEIFIEVPKSKSGIRKTYT